MSKRPEHAETLSLLRVLLLSPPLLLTHIGHTLSPDHCSTFHLLGNSTAPGMEGATWVGSRGGSIGGTPLLIDSPSHVSG